MLGGNGGLVSGNQGLSDFALMKDFRKSKIVVRYKFKNQIIQRTKTMEYANRYDAANVGEEFREYFLSHLRRANMLLEIEIWDRKWSNAQTYYHTRKPVKGRTNVDKGENASKGTYPPQYNHMLRG